MTYRGVESASPHIIDKKLIFGSLAILKKGGGESGAPSTTIYLPSPDEKRLLLRVSVSLVTNLPSKLTLPFPMGLHAMVESTSF